jgi:hypothetical protein
LTGEALGRALETLVKDGRIARTERRGRVEYESDKCLIPFGAPAGWEAAVFDHYQAMVAAVCRKLQLGSRQAERDDRIGGSTYSYLVWPGHPMEQEVYGLLAKLREMASRLREAVGTYNTLHPGPASGMTRVIAYVGQTLAEHDMEGEDS